MKTIATINFKGGVGKTTVTWCLGDVLSLYYDAKVLIFDLDAQMSLTQALSLDKEGSPSGSFDTWYTHAKANNLDIYSILRRYLSNGLNDFNPDGRFVYRLKKNYHFIPSSEELYWLELERTEPARARHFLRDLLGRIQNSPNFNEFDQIKDYDYVLFDCPPSFTMLSHSVLACCDLVLVPFNPDFFAARGIGLLVAGLRRHIEPHPLPKIGVFANASFTYRMADQPKRPTYAVQSWMRSVRAECESIGDQHRLDVRFMDAWIPHRRALHRAITNRRTPSEHVEDFRELWEESRRML